MISLVKRSLSKWIAAAMILVVGIVCIVAGATNSGESFNTISLVLGIILTVVGGVGVLMSIVASIVLRKAVLGIALGSGLVLAFGIFILVNQSIAGAIITYIMLFIPYILIVLGAIMVLNTVFTIVYAVKDKVVKSAISPILIGGLVGVSALVLGSLGVGNNPVIPHSAQLIIFGILIILVAILIALTTFVKMPSVVSVVTINEDK